MQPECECPGAPFDAGRAHLAPGPADHHWRCPLYRTSAQLDSAMRDHFDEEARAADPGWEAGPARFMEAMRDA